MINPIEFVKSHPVGTGVAVVVVIGAVFLLNAGGGGGGAVQSAPVATGDASTGAALQAAQLAASTETSRISAQKEVALAGFHSQEEIAGIQAQIAGQGLDVQKILGSMTIEADKAVAISNTTLQSQVQNNQIAAQLEAQKEAYGTINNQTNALVKINAQNNKPKGLFSMIFG